MKRMHLEMENIPVRVACRVQLGSWGSSGGPSPAEGAAVVRVSLAASQHTVKQPPKAPQTWDLRLVCGIEGSTEW